MPQETIVPRLRPEEFGLFAAVLGHDDRFPKTFGAWLDRTTFSPNRRLDCAVEIAFDEFMAYCRSSCKPPGFVALETLASSKFAG